MKSNELAAFIAKTIIATILLVLAFTKGIDTIFAVLLGLLLADVAEGIGKLIGTHISNKHNKDLENDLSRAQQESAERS